MNEWIKNFLTELFVWVIAIAMVVFLGFIFMVGSNYYCEKNPSPIMDDYCFDIDLRCNIECNSYNLNYTGKMHNGCACDCGDEYVVSPCSGFKYEKVE